MKSWNHIAWRRLPKVSVLKRIADQVKPRIRATIETTQRRRNHEWRDKTRDSPRGPDRVDCSQFDPPANLLMILFSAAGVLQRRVECRKRSSRNSKLDSRRSYVASGCGPRRSRAREILATDRSGPSEASRGHAGRSLVKLVRPAAK